MDEFDELLKIYEETNKGGYKEGFYQLRMAYKPLFDFYSRLLIMVGVDDCALPRNSLEHSYGSLRPLWGMVKPLLFLVDGNAGKWDQVINALHNVRTDAEHSLNKQISATVLKSVRDAAPEFKNWILGAGKEFFKRSPNFTFKEALYREVNFHVIEAELMLHWFGNKPPYMAEGVWEEEYSEIVSLLQELEKTKKELSELKDISANDLAKLFRLTQIVAKFRGREEGLLQKSTCPKCGGKISETQKSIGGSYEDEPSSIFYRVGCESCDYELNSETIDI